MTLKRIAGLIVIALLALVAVYAIEARAATLLPPGKQVFNDANGNPLAGGSVYFYVPGTTTPKDTYQDAGGTILNANPVILNGSGQAVIYGTGSYRQIVKDSLGNTIWDQLTADTAASNTSWAGTSGGTANAQTISAANFTSASGQVVSFIAGFTNTGALTLNVNGSGGLNVLKDLSSGPVSLTGGEVATGNAVQLIYDSTLGAFHLVSIAPQTVASGLNAISSTQGAVLYRNSTSWVALAPGASGQYLKTLGTSANPTWDYSGLIRRYYAENTTYSTLTTAMPTTDVVPTSTQGTQVLSVTVTVDDSVQIVRLRFAGTVAISTAGQMVAAIYQGSNAIAGATSYTSTANAPTPLILEKEVVPGAAGTYTYSVRLGPNTGSMYLNGTAGGRQLGGVSVSTLVAQVVKP